MGEIYVSTERIAELELGGGSFLSLVLVDLNLFVRELVQPSQLTSVPS